MRKIIKNLKHSKVPGHDGGVTISMTIQLSCHFVNHLVAIYKCALLQHFPAIRKKKQIWLQFPSKGRTPGLLRTVYVAASSVLWGLDRIKNFVFSNDLIPNAYFDFIPGCSTTHHLTLTDRVIPTGITNFLTPRLL